MTAPGAKQPFVGIDKVRGPARELFRSLSEAVTRSKLFSVMCPRFALSEACRHLLVLGCRGQTRRATWRRHEPCRSQQFVLLFADRMLRNLGTPIHCFGQLMRAIFLRPSLTTMIPSAQGLAPSRFDLRRGQARYGIVPKRRAPSANGYMPKLMHTCSNLNQISKKTKWPEKKSALSAYVRVHEDRDNRTPRNVGLAPRAEMSDGLIPQLTASWLS
jgi:hypothetical protein